MIERVETGIPGLDKLIEGGFVKGSVNLLAGAAGTGKTIFGCQFLLHGLRKNEPGVFLTLEQEKDEILKDVSVFGWDKEFEMYTKKKIFTLASEFPSKISDLKSKISDLLERTNAKRFVLDSLTVIEMGWGEIREVGKIRREVFDLIRSLKRMGVTSLLISEIQEGKGVSYFGFEEFIVDTVIILHYLEYAAGGTPRSLIVKKMRRTKHASEIFPFTITKKGIVVKKV